MVRLYNKGVVKYMDRWNILAFASVFINLSYIIILLVQTRGDKIDLRWKQKLNTLGAFASFIMWILTFYWMKIFKISSYYVAQLGATIDGVSGFVLITHFVIFAFANFFLVIDYNITNANENKENINDADLAHYN
jgi:hypothetical protein